MICRNYYWMNIMSIRFVSIIDESCENMRLSLGKIDKQRSMPIFSVCFAYYQFVHLIYFVSSMISKEIGFFHSFSYLYCTSKMYQFSYSCMQYDWKYRINVNRFNLRSGNIYIDLNQLQQMTDHSILNIGNISIFVLEMLALTLPTKPN